MFEAEKSRHQFIKALEAGRIRGAVLQKATAETHYFTDIVVSELTWVFGSANADYKRFIFGVLQVMRQTDKLDQLKQLQAQAKSPAAREELNKAVALLSGGSKPAAPSPAAASKPAQAAPPAADEDDATRISRLVNSKDVNSRKQGLKLFTEQPGWQKNRGMVAALLSDPNPELAEAMLRVVIKTAPRGFISQIRAAAHAEKLEVRALALQALVALKQADNVDILLARMPLETGDLQKAVYSALVAMIKADTADMTQRIVTALGNADGRVRQGAMSLLLKMPDQAATFQKILAFCGSINAEMRDQVFAELAKSADAFADLTLNFFRGQPDSALRTQALYLARYLKSQKLAPIFMHELKNPDWLVRHTAMMALGEMKAPQALNALVEQLNNPDASMAAVEALDKYRDLRLAKPLLAKLQSGNASEQGAVLRALENLADARLVAPLTSFVESNAPKGDVKKKTAEAIINLCQATQTAVPAKVQQIHADLAEKTVNDLPDLGLKLAE